jgi:hypothetical protein
MKRLSKLTLTVLLMACVGGLAACTRTVVSPLLVTAPAAPVVSPLPLTATTAPVGPTLPPPTTVPPTDTAVGVPPTNSPVPTATARAAAPNPTAEPASATPSALTPALAVTTAPGSQPVHVYLIAVGDNGKSGKMVGCGDSAVAVTVMVPHTTAVLRASLEALLAIKQQFYGESGLDNALYASTLQLQSLSLSGGKAVVHLTGTLSLGGECDNPRVQAQLEQTVLQFSTVKQADIYINGKTLAQALSLK